MFLKYSFIYFIAVLFFMYLVGSDIEGNMFFMNLL